jgi:hypothetical protein
MDGNYLSYFNDPDNYSTHGRSLTLMLCDRISLQEDTDLFALISSAFFTSTEMHLDMSGNSSDENYCGFWSKPCYSFETILTRWESASFETHTLVIRALAHIKLPNPSFALAIELRADIESLLHFDEDSDANPYISATHPFALLHAVLAIPVSNPVRPSAFFLIDSDSRTSFDNCTFNFDWAPTGSTIMSSFGSPFIDVVSGSLVVTSCTFHGGKWSGISPIRLSKTVASQFSKTVFLSMLIENSCLYTRDFNPNSSSGGAQFLSCVFENLTVSHPPHSFVSVSLSTQQELHTEQFSFVDCAIRSSTVDGSGQSPAVSFLHIDIQPSPRLPTEALPDGETVIESYVSLAGVQIRDCSLLGSAPAFIWIECRRRLTLVDLRQCQALDATSQHLFAHIAFTSPRPVILVDTLAAHTGALQVSDLPAS